MHALQQSRRSREEDKGETEKDSCRWIEREVDPEQGGDKLSRPCGDSSVKRTGGASKSGPGGTGETRSV